MPQTKNYWKTMVVKSVDRFKEGKDDAIKVVVDIIYKAEKEKEILDNLIKQYKPK